VYSSSPLQKGGTLIAEGVRDLATHGERLRDLDKYRPAWCPRCKGETLHVHDYVERNVRGNPDMKPISVVRFRCACAECGATWRVLPEFVARYLWYSWRTVEAATLGAKSVEHPAPIAPPPALGPCPSTVRRWQRRLGAAARLLVQVLATLVAPVLTAMIAGLRDGLDATRGALVVAYAVAMELPAGRGLAALAGHVHRLAPGLRLM